MASRPVNMPPKSARQCFSLVRLRGYCCTPAATSRVADEGFGHGQGQAAAAGLIVKPRDVRRLRIPAPPVRIGCAMPHLSIKLI